MILRIELWNFESYVHSVFDGLSAGINLIYGESDSGKTAAVRALRLVAYNEFDPASVRIGEKNCQVAVTTERGYVKVTRGKDNIWEVCKNGGKPRYFEKIGKNVLPEVTEVIGMSLVRLGDIDIPANIMDQAEGHFMLNELAGKEASGSVRAQVVDEISGLSGIEGIIKDVSLDRHRFGRDVKEQEDKANDLRSKMHDATVLASEEVLLSEVDALLQLRNEDLVAVEAMAVVLDDFNVASDDVGKMEAELAALPNVKMVSAILNKASKAVERVAAMDALRNDWVKSSEDLLRLKTEQSRIPALDVVASELDKAKSKTNTATLMSVALDEVTRARDTHSKLVKEAAGLIGLDNAMTLLETAKEGFEAVALMGVVRRDWEREKSAFAVVQKEQAGFPDLGILDGLLQDVTEAFTILGEMWALKATLAVEREADRKSRLEVESIEAGIIEASEDLGKQMLLVKVCPLSGAPVSASCFPEIRFPVLEEVET
jgi:hypothetical protein